LNVKNYIVSTTVFLLLTGSLILNGCTSTGNSSTPEQVESVFTADDLTNRLTLFGQMTKLKNKFIDLQFFTEEW
jgi:hypothetical protein